MGIMQARQAYVLQLQKPIVIPAINMTPNQVDLELFSEVTPGYELEFEFGLRSWCCTAYS